MNVPRVPRPRIGIAGSVVLMLAAVTAAVMGLRLVNEWATVRLQESLLTEARARCAPLPGERTILTNVDGAVKCERVKLASLPGLRWPWPR